MGIKGALIEGIEAGDFFKKVHAAKDKVEELEVVMKYLQRGMPSEKQGRDADDKDDEKPASTEAHFE